MGDVQGQLQRDRWLSHPKFCVCVYVYVLLRRRLWGFHQVLKGMHDPKKVKNSDFKWSLRSSLPFFTEVVSGMSRVVLPTCLESFHVPGSDTPLGSWLQSSFSSNCLNIIFSFGSIAAPSFPREVYLSQGSPFDSPSYANFPISSSTKVTQQPDALGICDSPIVCSINIYAKVFLWLKSNTHLLPATKNPK